MGTSVTSILENPQERSGAPIGQVCRADWLIPGSRRQSTKLLMIWMKMQTVLLGFPNSSPAIVKMQTAISYGCDCRSSPLCPYTG